ncbi:MAG: hypothetical protein GY884_06895 [Proteobacteria bacterium]|nr:hypothetical protein [Pseudomonadota bacterium]
MTVFLLLTSLAWADDCPSHPTPERFHDKVEAVKERVAFAEPDLISVLQDLEFVAANCVQGPILKEDLSGVLMARAAYAMLANGDPTEADIYLWRAAGLAGAKANEPLYGPDVAAALIAVLADDAHPATLDITFRWDPSVLVLDGEVHYDLGLNDVAPGWHVVQWRAEDVWLSEAVVLEPGGYAHVGDGSPTEIGSGDDEPAGDDSLMVEVRTGDRKGREKKERPGITAPPIFYVPIESSGQLVASGGYHIAQADVSDGETSFTGWMGLPEGRLRLRYGRRFRVLAEVGMGPPNTEGRAALLNRGRVMVGVAGSPSWTWQLAAGPVVGFTPGMLPMTEPTESPTFAGDLAYGAAGELSVFVKSVDFRVGGAWLSGAIEPVVSGGYTLDLDPIGVRVGAEVSALQLEQDRYVRGGLTGAVTWGF